MRGRECATHECAAQAHSQRVKRNNIYNGHNSLGEYSVYSMKNCFQIKGKAKSFYVIVL